ncbi:hypothetical protein CFN78_28110 [Amycolatopsis antarctica]|uniref:Uncharacterized protein n=1 Tax=Amycolatopsis antarctica TaxID=1854586 RepID=A0A263CUV9_9PSEU|nr:hypothetical protein [Amycolatopsis antarctica]OZM69891.1 hypothetical protein CFN78_28110 [Amycolatopsis antarctica]
METVMLIAAVTAAYLAMCALYPYAACSSAACEGGRLKAPNGKSWRNCRRCRGSGRRRRLGARLLGRAAS